MRIIKQSDQLRRKEMVRVAGKRSFSMGEGIITCSNDLRGEKKCYRSSIACILPAIGYACSSARSEERYWRWLHLSTAFLSIRRSKLSVPLFTQKQRVVLKLMIEFHNAWLDIRQKETKQWKSHSNIGYIQEIIVTKESFSLVFRHRCSSGESIKWSFPADIEVDLVDQREWYSHHWHCKNRIPSRAVGQFVAEILDWYSSYVSWNPISLARDDVDESPTRREQEEPLSNMKMEQQRIKYVLDHIEECQG